MTSFSFTLDAAVQSTPREDFIVSDQTETVFGHGIPTAKATQKILEPVVLSPDYKVLHLGSGTGYVTAILAKLSGQVYAIEQIESLAEQSRKYFRKQGVTNVEVHTGDGTKGLEKQAPFDAIVISTPSITDKSFLLNQLSDKGQVIFLEETGIDAYKLVKLTRGGQFHFERTDYGLVDFSSDRNEIFIDLDCLSEDSLNQAKKISRKSGTLMIDELRKLSRVDDTELYRSIASQYNLPLGNTDALLKMIDIKVFDLFSKAFLDYNRLIPLYEKDGTLTIATSDPDASIHELEVMYPEYRVEKILVTPTDFRRLWSALNICSQGKKTTLNKGVLEGHEAEKHIDNIDISHTNFEVHLVALFDALLLEAVAERASDIHIEQYNEKVRIRLRIDGELIDLSHYDLSLDEIRGLINVVKLRATLNIAERRLPQGGRSRLTVGEAIFDLRVQVQPSLHGEHVVIRLLPQSSTLITIEQLGLSEIVSAQYRRLLNNPAGLVLVVGPTGSGKSTTLYSGLQLLADDGRRKVITIEDPIEYSIDRIQQTRTRPEIGFNFADAMRSFVRQDPDIIMVGEIRDQETALEAIRASQTGHVVLSTLHCNDAIDALQRIFDLNIHPNSIASELLGVIAQRLAKRICSHCKKEVEPDPEILEELFPQHVPESFTCYEGKGCVHCNYVGTKGRIAVVEYLPVNSTIRNAISKQPPIGELRDLALDSGLITMRDSALDHVIQGDIPISELPRILPSERMAPEPRGQLDRPS